MTEGFGFVDNHKLEKAIKESGIPRVFIAGKLGMSVETLRRKLYGEFPWKFHEVREISDILNLSLDERLLIFHLKSTETRL